MRVALNTYMISPVSMGLNKAEKAKQRSNKRELASYIHPLETSKVATVPPLILMRGIRPNQGNVFDTFKKIDDVTRKINFVRSKEDWDNCLLEEMEEFTLARIEYEQNPTKQNYDHMEEEMGDIFYTAASISKDSGIDPEEAFRSTNRKFYNRINIMEKMLNLRASSDKKSLKDCSDSERRALWNTAKRKIYDTQTTRYQIEA